MTITKCRLDVHRILTIEHSASSYGIPVLVDDRDGVARGADEILYGETTLTGRALITARGGDGSAIAPLVRRFLGLRFPGGL